MIDLIVVALYFTGVGVSLRTDMMTWAALIEDDRMMRSAVVAGAIITALFWPLEWGYQEVKSMVKR